MLAGKQLERGRRTFAVEQQASGSTVHFGVVNNKITLRVFLPLKRSLEVELTNKRDRTTLGGPAPAVETGDSVFDEHFKVMGNRCDIFALLDSTTRAALLKHVGMVHLVGTALTLQTTPKIEPDELLRLITQLRTTADRLNSTVSAEALLERLSDPMVTVRLNAFDAAMDLPEIRSRALDFAEIGQIGPRLRCSELQLRAVAQMKSGRAAKLLHSLLDPKTPARVRRRAATVSVVVDPESAHDLLRRAIDDDDVQVLRALSEFDWVDVEFETEAQRNTLEALLERVRAMQHLTQQGGGLAIAEQVAPAGAMSVTIANRDNRTAAATKEEMHTAEIEAESE